MGLLLDFAVARLTAFLAEVKRLDECEFPYEHSQSALHRIRDIFQKKLDRLNKFDSQSNPDIVKQECMLSLSSLFAYVPLLGFILRSTNVRNSFEVFGPFLRLARDVLEHDIPHDQRKTCLVLSSEWDYSPFVYPVIPDLPGFVLIGLPAPESANPLLVPLAGHELGHALWARLDLTTKFRPLAKTHLLNILTTRLTDFQQAFRQTVTSADLTSDLFCVQYWEQAIRWTLNQAEETFCDFVGVWLFGQSYLNAFAYMLSPSIEGCRSIRYPNLQTRVQNLITAASKYGVSVPDGFSDMFRDQAEPNLMQSDTFLLSVTDTAMSKLVDELLKEVDTELSKAKTGKPSLDEESRIFDRFRQMVPAERCSRLADIVNAAWRAWSTNDLWSDNPQLAGNRDTIKELVLKNFEVLEIEQILGQSP